MNRDRPAFAFGVLTVCLSVLALWTAYGQVEWRLVGILVPIALVTVGIGILLLSRSRHN
jgi:uncharacterized membrane protein YfcA